MLILIPQFKQFPLLHGTFEIDDGYVQFKDNRLIFSQQMHNLSVKIGLDIRTIYHCQQKHGNNVAILNKLSKTRYIPDCDGLITCEKGKILMVKHADCAPIFLYDCKKQIIGILHSGWKGARDSIIGKALKLMQSEFKSKPEEVYIGIGPCAHSCCYYFESPWPHSELLKDHQWKPHVKRHGNKYFLDMPGFIKQSALKEGIGESNIYINQSCTICDKRFHSWTRQRQNGEQIKNGVSIIGLL